MSYPHARAWRAISASPSGAVTVPFSRLSVGLVAGERSTEPRDDLIRNVGEPELLKRPDGGEGSFGGALKLNLAAVVAATNEGEAPPTAEGQGASGEGAIVEVAPVQFDALIGESLSDDAAQLSHSQIPPGEPNASVKAEAAYSCESAGRNNTTPTPEAPQQAAA